MWDTTTIRPEKIAPEPPFFDYFNEAKKAGASDTHAYVHAIMMIDGVCCHPDCAIRHIDELHFICEACGSLFCQCEVTGKMYPGGHVVKWPRCAGSVQGPQKIATYKDREQMLAAILLASNPT